MWWKGHHSWWFLINLFHHPTPHKGRHPEWYIFQCHSWPQFKIIQLIVPTQNTKVPMLDSFVDAIGDDAIPNVDLSFLTCVPNIKDVINFVYSQDITNNPTTCLQCCILAPTIAYVDLYNVAVLILITSPSHEYHAIDSLKGHTEVAKAADIGSDTSSPLANPGTILNYVQHQHPNRMLDYHLMVKVSGVYCLLQNFSIDQGSVKMSMSWWSERVQG